VDEERNARISEIFYYFEKHTDIKNGRTVGRKIGVVQEILVKKMLVQDQRIVDCMVYEPRLRGRSNATHKVEFVLYFPCCVILLKNEVVARIKDPNLQVQVDRVDATRGRARIHIHTGEGTQVKVLGLDQALPVHIKTASGNQTIFIKLAGINEGVVRLSLLDAQRPIASIESKRVGAQRFSGTDALGSGIQTIEKAKQAALAAVDFDLLYNKTLLANSTLGETRNFRSFVVLGNGVHWTDHDLAVLGTYVDYTFLAKDRSIIRYAEFVRSKSEENDEEFFDFFMDYFQGTTKMSPDLFTVSTDDFELLRGARDLNLVAAIVRQIPKYRVLTIR